jgi:hypothetical protein
MYFSSSIEGSLESSWKPFLPDVPGSGEDVNQEGREVPASLPRISFHHWILVDLPASRPAIAAAVYRPHAAQRSRPSQAAGRTGDQRFTGWFANVDMAGDYFV